MSLSTNLLQLAYASSLFLLALLLLLIICGSFLYIPDTTFPSASYIPQSITLVNTRVSTQAAERPQNIDISKTFIGEYATC